METEQFKKNEKESGSRTTCLICLNPDGQVTLQVASEDSWHLKKLTPYSLDDRNSVQKFYCRVPQKKSIDGTTVQKLHGSIMKLHILADREQLAALRHHEETGKEPTRQWDILQSTFMYVHGRGA